MARPGRRSRGARGRPRRRPPGPPAARREAPGARLPVHLLLVPAGAASTLVPGVRRPARRWPDPGLRRGGARPPRPGRGHPRAAGRDRRTAGELRLLRDARVGDGLPPERRRDAALGVPAPARPARHRRGGRDAPDRVLALRCLPVLHRARAPPQHPRPGRARPAGVRAARVPARGHGPLQARLPARAAGLVRAGRRLLRARPRHPGPRHAGLAVRPRGPRLRRRSGSRRPRASRSTPPRSASSPSVALRCASG